jgi:hypothetical protein
MNGMVNDEIYRCGETVMIAFRAGNAVLADVTFAEKKGDHHLY